MLSRRGSGICHFHVRWTPVPLGLCQSLLPTRCTEWPDRAYGVIPNSTGATHHLPEVSIGASMDTVDDDAKNDPIDVHAVILAALLFFLAMALFAALGFEP
jgi:hypothetical protein